MRRILVAIVAAPVLLGIYAAALVSGSGHRRMMVRGLALFLVLAVGVFGVLRFTAAPASAGKPAAPDPSAVAGAAQPVVTNFNPNQAVRLDFSVPMDRVSVQNALSVEPPTATTLTWSETGTSVNVVPGGAWEPGTFYTVTVGTAARSEVGQPLARPLHAVILTRSAPTAKIAATRTADGRALATSGFTVSFDRPVDVESVRAAFKIAPAVKGTLQVAGKGATAHRFTFVPLRPLVPDTTYTVTLAGPVVDADDIEVAAAPRLQVRTVAKAGTPTKTASAPAAVSVAAEEPAAEATPTPVTTPDETPGATPAAPSAEATASPGPSATPAPTPSPAAEVILMAPAVVRFRPLNGATNVSTSQAVSVRFTQPMDHASTQAAFKLSGYDMKKGGEFYWAEGDTVLVFEPAKPLAYGTKYTLTVGGGAKAKTGAMITVPSNKKAIVSTFKVAAKPKPLPVPPKPGAKPQEPPARPLKPTVKAPWLDVEQYALKLLNCNRTGGKILANGSCEGYGSGKFSAYRPPLRLDAAISNSVARPYAKYQAIRRACNHFIDGDPGDRMARAGYRSPHWAENIGCRPASVRQSILGSALFFQAEQYAGYRGHWINLKNPDYDRVGIGVWASGGWVLSVYNFYRP